MSELIDARKNGRNFRWRLLGTVSAIALIGSMYEIGEALASDGDAGRPTLWIELGGQLNRLDDGQEAFAPDVMAGRPAIFAPSQKFEQSPQYNIDKNGSITFQPEDSNWVFSASVRYGRSTSDQHARQQTYPKTIFPPAQIAEYFPYRVPLGAKFADTLAQRSESHFLLDFQAGRDVGLGMFGIKNGSSVFNFGVRFAQFSSKSNITLQSDPDFHFSYKYSASYHFSFVKNQFYHSNQAKLQATRSFHGVGPSISWKASAPVLGNAQDGELEFDWGANAALLFGRQRASTHHQTTARYHVGKYYPGNVATFLPPASSNRERAVTVPNAGGFAGLSVRYAAAKVSFGYRADFFFGAIDGGIDVRKTYNRGFYGPFATISVGIP